jgi:glycosyltransferase involved in cell wall biosynthesis
LKPTKVMQVVDSLTAAGMEAVAVNLGNLLSQKGLTNIVCTTRATGPLESRIANGVQHLHLARKGIVGAGALKRLARFLKEQQVDLVHAHGSSVFFSVLAGCFAPPVKVVWHDHFGRYATEKRPAWLFRLAMRRAAGVIAVNEPLAEWARTALRVPADRVWYVPNCVAEPPASLLAPGLPGTPGRRIVCVANLRPEKDHLTLVDAMKLIAEAEPSATLLLVGDHANSVHVARIKERIGQHGLTGQVFLLGSRHDVPSLLSGCDVGVLSSASEGLPLALLEYGMARLPAVATRIGQVPEVLDEGRAGLLVTPGRADELAAALLRLFRSAELREKLGWELGTRVREHYNEAAFLRRILSIYETVLGASLVPRDSLSSLGGEGRGEEASSSLRNQFVSAPV